MRKGQAFLALVLLIGGVLLTAGIALAIIVISTVNATYGYQDSQTAENVAVAGANDALIQLARTNTFSSSGYTVTVPSGSATVVVTQNSPSSGLVTITSQATISNRVRKVQVVVSVNGTTGQSSLVSWQDI